MSAQEHVRIAEGPLQQHTQVGDGGVPSPGAVPYASVDPELAASEQGKIVTPGGAALFLEGRTSFGGIPSGGLSPFVGGADVVHSAAVNPAAQQGEGATQASGAASGVDFQDVARNSSTASHQGGAGVIRAGDAAVRGGLATQARTGEPASRERIDEGESFLAQPGTGFDHAERGMAAATRTEVSSTDGRVGEAADILDRALELFREEPASGGAAVAADARTAAGRNEPLAPERVEKQTSELADAGEIVNTGEEAMSALGEATEVYATIPDGTKNDEFSASVEVAHGQQNAVINHHPIDGSREAESVQVPQQSREIAKPDAVPGIIFDEPASAAFDGEETVIAQPQGREGTAVYTDTESVNPVAAGISAVVSVDNAILATVGKGDDDASQGQQHNGEATDDLLAFDTQAPPNADTGTGNAQPPSPPVPPEESYNEWNNREQNIKDYARATILLERLSLRQGVNSDLLGSVSGLVQHQPIAASEDFLRNVATVRRKACLTSPDFHSTLRVLTSLRAGSPEVDQVIPIVEQHQRTAFPREKLVEFLALSEPGSARFVAAERLFQYELEKDKKTMTETNTIEDLPFPSGVGSQLLEIRRLYESAYGVESSDTAVLRFLSGDLSINALFNEQDGPAYFTHREEALMTALRDLSDIERDHRDYVSTPDVYGKYAELYSVMLAYFKTQHFSLNSEEGTLRTNVTGGYIDYFPWIRRARRRVDFKRGSADIPISGEMKALNVTNSSTPDLLLSYLEFRGISWTDRGTYTLRLVDSQTYAQSLSMTERLRHAIGTSSEENQNRRYVLIYEGDSTDNVISSDQGDALTKVFIPLLEPHNKE